MLIFLFTDAGRRLIGFLFAAAAVVILATLDLRDAVLPLVGPALSALASLFRDLVISGAGVAQTALDGAVAAG